MASMMFRNLDTRTMCDLVHSARSRVLYCAPGLQQPLAAALVNSRQRLGKRSVRVVVDATAATARMGYGDFEAIALLNENDVDVRVEKGLRTCALVCDALGTMFFCPPLLVESEDDGHIGLNALDLEPVQVQAVLAAFFTSLDADGEPLAPTVGKEVLTETRVREIKESLDANPPQKFDWARKVNVFNSAVEFADLRLTGLHISRHTVRLPADLVLALNDDETAKRLLATFRLVDDKSKVAKEAKSFDGRVRSLRERYMRSLGDGLGNVILRSQRSAFSAEVRTIQEDITKFQADVMDRLSKEIAQSKRTLVEGLLPAAKKSTPPALQAQISGKPSVEILRRFLEDELGRAFPSAQSLMREMRLEWVPKGVTYETLCNPEFQMRLRDAFPYENWDKPFSEFEAAPATGGNGDLFRPRPAGSHDKDT